MIFLSPGFNRLFPVFSLAFALALGVPLGVASRALTLFVIAARAVSLFDSVEIDCISCISLVRRVEYCLKFDFEAFPDADVIQFWYRGPVPLA